MGGAQIRLSPPSPRQGPTPHPRPLSPAQPRQVVHIQRQGGDRGPGQPTAPRRHAGRGKQTREQY